MTEVLRFVGEKSDIEINLPRSLTVYFLIGKPRRFFPTTDPNILFTLILSTHSISAMSPPETSEKIEAVSPSATSKVVSTGIDEYPVPGKENLHLVERTGNEDGLVQYDDSDSINGFNAAVMGARVTLSNVEEKKLLRRIDWRLIPLLSLMYMLKSVDYSNVCFHPWLLHGIYLTV